MTSNDEAAKSVTIKLKMKFTGHLKKKAKGSLPFTFQIGKLESKNILQI